MSKLAKDVQLMWGDESVDMERIKQVDIKYTVDYEDPEVVLAKLAPILPGVSDE